jgi:2'-5' RNA ligase
MGGRDDGREREGSGEVPGGPAPTIYLALRPDEATRALIEALLPGLQFESGLQRGFWLGESSWHVSLIALSRSPDAFPPAIQEALEVIRTVDLPAFDLTLDQTGTFDQKDGTYIGWLGCQEVPAAFLDLGRCLNERLRRAGVSGGFQPSAIRHMTLVRGADRPLPETTVVPIRWRVDRFVLVHTVLWPEFSQRDLASIPLRR